MKLTKKSFLLFFLLCASLGAVLLPNVLADEGTKNAFANSEFFTIGLQYTATPSDSRSYYYHDDFVQCLPLKLGVSQFQNLGYKYFDNASGKAYFLGLADVEVIFQIYTNYAEATDIFKSGFVPDQTAWLDLYTQKYFPYGADDWTHTSYNVEYNNIKGAENTNGLNNGHIGFSTDFLFETELNDFSDYFAIPYFSDTAVFFDIPEIALADARVLSYETNVDLDTEYEDIFINTDSIPEFNGWSGVNIGTAVEIPTIFSTLGLVEGSVHDISSVQLSSARIDPPTNHNMFRVDQNTASLYLRSNPELWVYQQKFDVNYGKVYADIKGSDAGLIAGQGGYTSTKSDIVRNVGFKVENQEIKLTMQFRYYVWGTAELGVNVRDELLNSPEFIRGDVYWDCAFWGDTSASTIFTESGFARVWKTFWSGGLGRTIKWILIIAVIILFVIGTLWLLAKTGLLKNLFEMRMANKAMQRKMQKTQKPIRRGFF